MPYATLQDLETRFGQQEINQLADRDCDGGNDVDVVEEALAAATSEIDSYIAVRYTVPITSISDNLNKVCCDIARYLLHENAAIDEVEKRYSRAVSWLKDIAAGKAVLTDESGQPIVDGAPSSGSSIKHFSTPRRFDDKSMAGY